MEAADQALELAIATAHTVGDRSMEGAMIASLANHRTLQGRYDEAHRLVDEAQRVGGRHPNPGRSSEMALAILELVEGDVASAVEQFEGTIAWARRHAVQFLGGHLPLLATAKVHAGDLEGARADFDEALALARSTGNALGLGVALVGRAVLARMDGDPESAETHAHEALEATSNLAFRIGALELLAGVASVQQSALEAARLFGAASAARDRTHMARFAVDQPAHDRDVALARDAAGDEAFRAAWDEGAALSFDAAVAYARRGRGERKRPSSGWASLTPAELQIVPLVAQHLTNAQIGERLFMSPATVKTHLQHIYAKLGIGSRSQLGAEAVRRGVA